MAFAFPDFLDVAPDADSKPNNEAFSPYPPYQSSIPSFIASCTSGDIFLNLSLSNAARRSSSEAFSAQSIHSFASAWTLPLLLLFLPRSLPPTFPSLPRLRRPRSLLFRPRPLEPSLVSSPLPPLPLLPRYPLPGFRNWSPPPNSEIGLPPLFKLTWLFPIFSTLAPWIWSPIPT